MDDLLILASELVENNNFKKTEFTEDVKPDGEYLVSIENIALKVSAEKGTEWFSFVFKILDGELITEKIYVNTFLTDKTIKRSLSTIMKLIDACGYTVDLSMFNDKDTMLESLQVLKGQSVLLNKTTSTGGFINYSFRKGE